jgi:hypothetical protein
MPQTDGDRLLELQDNFIDPRDEKIKELEGRIEWLEKRADELLRFVDSNLHQISLLFQGYRLDPANKPEAEKDNDST